MRTPLDRNGAPGRSGLAESQDPAPERSAGLARFVLLTSLGVGVLAGLAEVCWSYLLPSFGTQWRAVLPASGAGVLSFCAAAVATDVVLVSATGAVLLTLLLLLVRVTRLSGTSTRLQVLVRAMLVGGVSCYLYTGWITLFVLLAADRRTLAYGLMLVMGATASLLLALLLSAALEAAKRRWRRAVPTVWCGGVVVLLATTTSLCSHYRTSEGPAWVIAGSTTGPRPNVLLVTLDTLRADYLGCYGHPWIKTPTMDELALDGMVFDTAISQAPSTAPSHCTIMTSVYPFDHGAENGKPMKRGLVTLADVLHGCGYETVAFTSSTTTRSINSGLHQGFDRYADSLVPWSEIFGRDEFQHLIFFYLAGIAQHSQIPGEVVTDRALHWLERRSSKPFFAWLHYFDPHGPYGSPPPFRDMYRGEIVDGLPMATQRERYAEDITYADSQLGRFIDALKRKSLYDNTLIIVASDHGEAFGERHGEITEIGHGRYLYDTTQHVPLVVKLANVQLTARRVSEQVELADVAPTVLDLLEIDVPSRFRGKSLAKLIDGRLFSYAGRDACAFNVIDVPGVGKHDVAFVQQLAVRSPQWKFIARPRLNEEELYDLLEDPGESSDVVHVHPQLAAQRRTQAMQFWDSERDTSEDPRQRLAPALVRQLQALGYLGASDDKGDG